MEDRAAMGESGACIALTKCRLCGEGFQEEVYMDDLGILWKPTLDRSGENQSPWCPVCLGDITRRFEKLCAGMQIFAE